jgi:hypothetical protein
VCFLSTESFKGFVSMAFVLSLSRLLCKKRKSYILHAFLLAPTVDLTNKNRLTYTEERQNSKYEAKRKGENVNTSSLSFLNEL